MIERTAGSLPFLSSDGQWVGFWNNSSFELQKVAITGGAATKIARVDGVIRGRGAEALRADEVRSPFSHR
jgi:hypothetical protein